MVEFIIMWNKEENAKSFRDQGIIPPPPLSPPLTPMKICMGPQYRSKMCLPLKYIITYIFFKQSNKIHNLHLDLTLT